MGEEVALVHKLSCVQRSARAYLRQNHFTPAQAGELKLKGGGGRAQAEAVLRAAQRASVPLPNVFHLRQAGELKFKSGGGAKFAQ